MSITSSAPDSQGIAHTALGQQCFMCGRKLRDPDVHWMGVTVNLFLHPACVLSLFVRLARDLHEIQKPSYYRDRLRRWR